MWFCLDTLEYLRRGGRIGAAQAMVGTALRIKPILTFGTEITPVDKVRTKSRALARMNSYLEQLKERGATDWIVQHAQSAEDAERTRRQGPRDLRLRAALLHPGRPGPRRPPGSRSARRRRRPLLLDEREDVSRRVLEPGDQRTALPEDPLLVGLHLGSLVAMELTPRAVSSSTAASMSSTGKLRIV